MLNKIVNFVQVHVVMIVTILLCFIVAVAVYGCQPTVESMITPGKRVNRTELEAEVAYFNAQVKTRFTSLDEKEAIMKLISDQLVLFAQGGQPNPSGILLGFLTILSGGYALDQRGKKLAAHKKIATLQGGSAAA